MTTSYGLRTVVVLSCVFAAVALAHADPPAPNIVLIMADDVGREALGCYGGTTYQTPQLDRLAAGGMRFDHYYCMAVCHPTRIALMTGRYPFRYAARWGGFPDDATTFGQLLRDAGYATAVAGKWQLTLLRDRPEHPQQLGFDRSALFGWHEGPRFHRPLIWQNGAIRKDLQRNDVYGPDEYCDFLIEFMRRNRQRPFLAYYSMALCHEISDDFSPVPPPAPDGHYLSFAEMVADMDRIVGRLVAAIDELGLRQRTLILFTTDNGSPGRYLTGIERRDGKLKRLHAPVVAQIGGRDVQGGKGKLTDDGTRVPLIANWPGVVAASQRSDALVDVADILPTLAELAGAELPDPPPDGRSFAAHLAGEADAHREWVYAEHQGRWWVRNRRWKLYNDQRLYDMRADPQERNPIAPAEHTDQAGAARRALHAAGQSLRGEVE